ncbi:MAG TPA: farnesyl-diphosphate synthase [Clostridiales bacterium]|nr:farnesyl-diphosphate synthase [Clostridiales bacterium]
MNNRFSDVLHQKADLINAYLDSKVSQKDNLQGIVYEAMRYSLLAGGKRIRPVLALAAGQVLGEQEARILPFACAIEMIHTYSLIHDDLPAMDDDDYRRGRYSCHKKFGEATAILAGDALLTMAFEIAAEGALALEDPKRGLRAIRHIALSAGTEGMIGGQIVDLDAETRAISESELRYLCERKTGALLRAPVLAAAAVAGAEETRSAALLLEYADTIGLAFQIKDDILDVEGDISVLGKATGSDAKDGKTTFVTLYGIQRSKTLLEDLTNRALAACDQLISLQTGAQAQDACAFLKELAFFLLERTY